MTLSTIVVILYCLTAGAFSIFYGLKAIEIFLDPIPENKSCSWKFHQFWLNFAGSVVGWLCLWFIGSKILPCLGGTCPEQTDWWWNVVITFFAFVGVTGHLPTTVVALVQSIGALVGKIAGIQK